MVTNDCGEIPVLDPAGHPIGVITDRDIVCRVVAEGRNPRRRRLLRRDHRPGRLATIGDQQEVAELVREVSRERLDGALFV
jgi:CBS domain-containing protein